MTMLHQIFVQIWILSVFTTVGSCSSHGGMLDVIIVGGGASGVRAAARLEEHGITNIKIIEREDKLGGLLRAGHINGLTVELGPGRLWENEPEIMELANRYNLKSFPYPTDKVAMFNESGSDVTQEVIQILQRHRIMEQAVNEYAETLRRHDYPDISVSNAYSWRGFSTHTPTERMVNFLIFNIRDDPQLDSLKYYVGKDGPVRVVEEEGNGYANLVINYADEYIMDLDSKLELNTHVTRIVHNEDNVTVETDNGHFAAKQVIVAYSLGELQHQSMVFEPPLPDWKMHPIHGYGVTHYVKIFLRFPDNEPWFIPEDIYRVGHVSERPDYYMFWQNYEQYHNGSRVVGCFIRDEQAFEIRRKADEVIMPEAVAVLRLMFGDNVPDAEEIFVPRGDEDPLLYGAYSYWPVGFTEAEHAALKAAVGQVHFAEDYYMGGRQLALQASWNAGRMVADNVKSCMDNAAARPDICGHFRPSYMARGCTYDLALNYDPMAKEDDGSCWLVGIAPDTAGHVEASVTAMLAALIISLIY